MKLAFIDVETTGTIPEIQDIIQMAGWINNEPFDFKCQPANYDKINPKAMDANKLTIEQLKTFPEPLGVYYEFINLLKKHVNIYDPLDRMVIVGHNAFFDKNFIFEFINKHTEKGPNGKPVVYPGSFFYKGCLCTMGLYTQALFLGLVKKPKQFTLSTLCELCDIKLEFAHNAFYDITATRKLFFYLIKLLHPNYEYL